MNVLSCSNCTGYDDGGCQEMAAGMVPEQCQLFEPIHVLSKNKSIIDIRGMKVLTSITVLTAPKDKPGPISEEELKGHLINTII